MMHLPKTLPLLACCLLLAATATAAEDKPAASQGLCELRIDGSQIVLLLLEGTNGSSTTCERPGKVLRLPAGLYRVAEVQLENQYRSQPRVGSKAGPWFELTAERPSTVKVGSPLLSTAKVTRQGPYLQMDYDLVDAEGRSYTQSGGIQDRSTPPRFAVYQGDEKIGSGSFEYG